MIKVGPKACFKSSESFTYLFKNKYQSRKMKGSSASLMYVDNTRFRLSDTDFKEMFLNSIIVFLTNGCDFSKKTGAHNGVDTWLLCRFMEKLSQSSSETPPMLGPSTSGLLCNQNAKIVMSHYDFRILITQCKDIYMSESV